MSLFQHLHCLPQDSQETGNQPAARSSSFSALPQWADLPSEICRQVLRNDALSLLDLAKVAPVHSVYKEAYLGRCAADEQWLENITIDCFGRSTLEALLRWLVTSSGDRQSRIGRKVLLWMRHNPPWMVPHSSLVRTRKWSPRLADCFAAPPSQQSNGA
jgi:hypothetical protein